MGLFGKSEIPKHQVLRDEKACLTLSISHRQIRQGIANNSKGTAFVVYEDVHDAKQACDKLNGFNFQNRYLVGMYTRMMERKRDQWLIFFLLLQFSITSRRKWFVRKRTFRKDKKTSNVSNSSMV